MIKRFKLLIEYDGTPFMGWQRQERDPTIQGEIEKAITKFCGETPTLHVCGRTDAGVHALGQVAHVDLMKPTDTYRLRQGLNFYLKDWPITILDAIETHETFDARRDAKRRIYLYRIMVRSTPPALLQNRVWHVRSPLDVQAMHTAAQHLIGKHDFTSFRAAHCQATSPIRTLDSLSVSHVGDEIHVVAKAPSFLYHQVRNMVGSLKKIGDGSWTPGFLKEILELKDRRKAGPTAPACGLYFVSVAYSEPNSHPV